MREVDLFEVIGAGNEYSHRSSNSEATPQQPATKGEVGEDQEVEGAVLILVNVLLHGVAPAGSPVFSGELDFQGFTGADAAGADHEGFVGGEAFSLQDGDG